MTAKSMWRVKRASTNLSSTVSQVPGSQIGKAVQQKEEAKREEESENKEGELMPLLDQNSNEEESIDEILKNLRLSRNSIVSDSVDAVVDEELKRLEDEI